MTATNGLVYYRVRFENIPAGLAAGVGRLASLLLNHRSLADMLFRRATIRIRWCWEFVRPGR